MSGPTTELEALKHALAELEEETRRVRYAVRELGDEATEAERAAVAVDLMALHARIVEINASGFWVPGQGGEA